MWLSEMKSIARNSSLEAFVGTSCVQKCVLIDVRLVGLSTVFCTDDLLNGLVTIEPTSTTLFCLNFNTHASTWTSGTVRLFTSYLGPRSPFEKGIGAEHTTPYALRPPVWMDIAHGDHNLDLHAAWPLASEPNIA